MMGLFKRISSFFSPSTTSEAGAYWVYVKCNRCGEKIRARINLANDLSANFEDDKTIYFCRKTLMGEGHCFQRVEVELTFNKDRRLLNREINGGQFISAEAYSQDQPPG